MFTISCTKCKGSGLRRYVVLAADHRSQRDNFVPCRTCKSSGEVKRKTITLKVPADSVELLYSCLEELLERNSFGANTVVFAELRAAIDARLGRRQNAAGD